MKKLLTDEKDDLLLSKEKIFKNIYNRILTKIEELTKNIDYDDLKFLVYSSNRETNFIQSKYTVAFLEDIRTNEITIEQVQYN